MIRYLALLHVISCGRYGTISYGRAVASWFVTMHAGSSPDWGTVRTGPLASLLTLSFFVLSRQCLKMRVLGVDVET